MPAPGGTYGMLEVGDGAMVSLTGDLVIDEDPVISGSQLTLSGGISVPGNLTLEGSALTVSGLVSVPGTLALLNGSVLSHAVATTTLPYSLDLQATAIAVDSTSKIDVTGKGYLGGWQGGNTGNTAMTRDPATGLPTTIGGSGVQSGGSHGGLGGMYSTGAVNAAYGDLTNPDDPGSGGGGYTSPNPGGNGGGLVRITAGTLTLDGSIVADGGKGYGTYHGGGGSGGGVLINVGNLSGGGTISARGGAGSTYYSSGGGGGRIAIHYDTLSLPGANITAWGGKGDNNGSTAACNGGAGTVYLKPSGQAYGDLILSNGGIATTTVTPVPGGGYRSLEVGDGARVSLTGDLVTMTDLAISGSELTLSGGISVPGNLTLKGSALTVSGAVLIPGNLVLQNGSILSHTAATATALCRLDLQAAAITVDSTSKIDVTGKGFLGGWQGGNAGNTAMTRDPVTGLPTTAGGSGLQSGGSHGGLGGMYSTGAVNAAYGDLTNPNDPGSGGGGYTSPNPGGNGGGLMRITAGVLTLDGCIVADGGKGPGTYHGGGGGGGGILINAGTLSGGGSINARGGAGSTYYSSGGGGGRIAIYYDTLTLPGANITASGGKGDGNGSTAACNGGAGTVYLKSNAEAHGDLVVDNGGIDARVDSGWLSVIGRGTVSAVTSASLTDASATWVPGALKGLKINPNTSQHLAFTVLDNDATTIFIDPAEGDMAAVAATGDIYAGVYTFRQMAVRGKARARCDERLLVDDALDVDGGTLVAGQIMANRVSLINGGVLSHANTTTALVYDLEISALDSLMVDAASSVDVTGRGYLGGYSGGNNSNTGRTFGNTTTGGSVTYSGGSYGGPGGLYGSYPVGAVYGSPTGPNEPGSGGGACCNGYPGGNGGGLVKVSAGTLTLEGSILADGGNGSASGSASGGGSGGGVFINASTLAGAGTVSARGGASSLAVGAGGGGRIAVYYDGMTLPAANVAAAGGTSSNAACNGGAGTVYLQAK